MNDYDGFGKKRIIIMLPIKAVQCHIIDTIPNTKFK